MGSRLESVAAEMRAGMALKFEMARFGDGNGHGAQNPIIMLRKTTAGSELSVWLRDDEMLVSKAAKGIFAERLDSRRRNVVLWSTRIPILYSHLDSRLPDNGPFIAFGRRGRAAGALLEEIALDLTSKGESYSLALNSKLAESLEAVAKAQMPDLVGVFGVAANQQ